MSTPMAIMASKGAVEGDLPPLVVAVVEVDVGRSVREGVEEERRSPAPRVDVVVDWIWDAE